MSSLVAYTEKQVLLITQDGRVIVGQLRGFDTAGSIILSQCIERIYSAEDGVEELPLGLYIVRGDAIALIGEMDVEKDKAIDHSSVRAEPLPEVRHG
ncbi:hypothetical protein K437DRAFT_132640 [Tilletiaria anomala UBC 951]|uniref:LSM2-LSM8 complex subunit LSM8 n=1 Tax=Tilletiaria anomala (strain ATCC 24038 / CBS 436.72 / UBC 951) TaxID=1037660 RepID=A0A066WK37_TILAU|nr:uncharacterized protein K437DRAFT_132640 [Tilletiaria anomala UBC 951]KDN52928.1 hypothetical protein K437DRAFT_132640 [Tilletiaria anomala UBC 951]